MFRKRTVCVLAFLLYLFLSPELFAQPSTQSITEAGAPVVRLSAQDNDSSGFTRLAQQVVPLSPGLTSPIVPLFNNGQDPTRTLRRLDFRYEYARLENNNDADIFAFRADDVLNLSPTWRISGRLELPLIYSNQLKSPGFYPSSDPYRFGTGNLLAQVLGIHDISERTAVALGSAFVFPTATQSGFANRKYVMLPTGVARWMLPEISEGSFFAPVIRYGFDFAGPTHRIHTSELQFSPMINIGLPDFWFITLFPNTFGSDIRYNLGTPQPNDKGRLFLPLDVMVSKTLSWGRDVAVASLEMGVPIVNDYRSSPPPGSYKFKLAARIGLFW